MKIKLRKSQWEEMGKTAGWIKTALNVSQNYFVNLFGEYDPIKYSQAQKKLLSVLQDGKEYNLGAVTVKWSSKNNAFLGGNYFINADFGDIYIALKNDGVSDEEIKKIVEN